MLQSKFVQEVPKWIVNKEYFPFALGYCASTFKNPNINHRIPVAIIDRILLFASTLPNEEEMFYLISKVPIHEICHIFDKSAEW